MRRSIAFTHGPQARKRSATAWSVMDSYRAVKVPATSRKDLSKPQYKKTTRKSCAGVLTFLALTNALNSRAICMVSGGRSCKSSSKSVSGSVRGNCMGRFSCRQQGKIFTSCSMPFFSPIYSLSWRLWACGLGVGAGQPAPLKGGTAEALPAMGNPLSVHTERSTWCAGDSCEPHECHRFSSTERWKGYLDRRSLPHQRSYGAREGSCSAGSKRTSPREKSQTFGP